MSTRQIRELDREADDLLGEKPVDRCSGEVRSSEFGVIRTSSGQRRGPPKLRCDVSSFEEPVYREPKPWLGRHGECEKCKRPRCSTGGRFCRACYQINAQEKFERRTQEWLQKTAAYHAKRAAIAEYSAKAKGLTGRKRGPSASDWFRR